MGGALKNYTFIVAAIAFFVLGLFLDQIGFKAISTLAVLATLAGVLLAPLHVALAFVITFIWFQGFFKIISNYNPIVHVGADLVLIALVTKVLFLGLKDNEKKLPPLSWLFALHFIWVLITYFNPYSLGIVPTIAGSKVYISMFLLYFFGYYLTKNLNDVKRLFGLFIILAFIQIVFTIYQGLVGVESVLSIHPRYAVQLAKYREYAFRPFGLTHLPGAPSVYIYVVLPFIAYFIYISRSKILKLFFITGLPLSGLALFMCQVRSAIGKALIALILFIISFSTSNIPISTTRRLYYIFGSAIVGAFTAFAMMYLMNVSVDFNEENERSLERSFSTFDISAMSSARRGTWDRFILYIKDVPFGAGFSRVGAASGAFQKANEQDPFFPPGYFFTDNLFLNILIELGIPGLIILTTLIFSILFIGFRLWRYEVRIQLIGPQLAIWSSLIAITAGSYGGEGIIYNPESCFFWLFAGVMMSMKDVSFDTKP